MGNARTFKQYFEEMTADSAGVGGTGDGFSPSNITSSDSYAPGDARVPKVLGKVQRRRKKKKKEEDAEEPMCPEACCGKPVKDCTCGPDCPHCDCYEKNNA